MNSLAWLNWGTSPDGTLAQGVRNVWGDNIVTYGTESASINNAWGQNDIVNSSISATLNQPIRHGWGENILPFRVADQLNKAALTRSPVVTAPSMDRGIAEAMTVAPRQEQQQLSYLPPEVPVREARKGPSFVALQEWEGVVTEIQDNVFTARLVDLTHSNPDEESEFSVTEISDDDVDLVVRGAIFRWSVGILRTPGGTKRATSQVVFRRLPQWTKRDLDRADSIVKDLAQKFETTQSLDSHASHTA